jgi:hypothetical protein
VAFLRGAGLWSPESAYSGVHDTASTRGVTMRMSFGVQCKSKLEQFKAEQEAAKDEDLDMFGD